MNKKTLAIILTAAVVVATIAYFAWRSQSDVLSTGTPVEETASGRFSMDSIQLPETFEQHLAFNAGLIQNYNKVAPTLWLDNSILNVYAVYEDKQTGAFWFVSPEGATRQITQDEAVGYGLDLDRRAAEAFYHHFGDGVGYYYLLDIDDLNDFKIKHLQFSPLVPFRTLVHEGFHMTEQYGWASAMDVVYDFETMEMLVSEEEMLAIAASINIERDEFLENTEARISRHLLMRDLRIAVVNKGNEDYLLKALATYANYMENFGEEESMGRDNDRGEGTATFFDAIAILNGLFPGEIKTKDDLQEALAFWMDAIAYEDYYTGLVIEGYFVDGFASMLLDRYVDSRVWQRTVMDDCNATPMSLLFEHFSDRQLPAPSVASQSDIEKTEELIKKSMESTRVD